MTIESRALPICVQKLKKVGKLSTAYSIIRYSTNRALIEDISENQPPNIAEVADFTKLLCAGLRQLQEVLETSGHPSSRDKGAWSGRAGTSSVAGNLRPPPADILLGTRGSLQI